MFQQVIKYVKHHTSFENVDKRMLSLIGEFTLNKLKYFLFSYFYSLLQKYIMQMKNSLFEIMNQMLRDIYFLKKYNVMIHYVYKNIYILQRKRFCN